MEQLQKNTVSGKNQLKAGQHISYLHPDGKGPRIVFAGNSITRHGVKEDIGWFWNFGMAASSAENDYVHLVTAKLREKADVCACVAQVAAWETDFKNGDTILPKEYEAVRDFDADILIMRCIENCHIPDEDLSTFKKEYEKLIDYFNPHGRARVILTTSFWRHPGDPMIEAVAVERGYPLAKLGDLGEDDEMKAIGLFEHGGVANHPGDKGMAEIARRILEKIEL